MNFDQVGKQHISRRPRPSPLRDSRRLPHSPEDFDANFSQKVWPRPDHFGSYSGGTIFNRTPHENDTYTENSSQEQGHSARHSAGFSFPASWARNILVAAGVMVIGLVVIYWDRIAPKIGAAPQVPIQTLQDPDGYTILGAQFESRWNPDFTSEPPKVTEGSGLLYGEIPLNLTDTFSWSLYRVKQGDTISGIASKFPVSSESIVAFNGIKEAWNLRAGAELKIPNMDGIPYTVQKNDSLSKIAVKMKVPQNAIADANNLLSEVIQPGEMLFIPGAHMDANEFKKAINRPAAVKTPRMIFPVSGRITSAFGWREDPVRPRPGEKTFHRAVDLAGKMGDPIKAALSGTVLYIDNNPNLGNFIILKHDNNYQTLYAHLSAFSVKPGEKVQQGDIIGKVGDTGYTTGPHLHFEAFHNGNRINPLELLK